MKAVLLSILSLVFLTGSFSFAAEAKKREPNAVNFTIWETREIPVGKVCPSQAQRFDLIAYQYKGGGYVCYECDYTDATPFLVVTQQARCNTTIKCKNGKCE